MVANYDNINFLERQLDDLSIELRRLHPSKAKFTDIANLAYLSRYSPEPYDTRFNEMYQTLYREYIAVFDAAIINGDNQRQTGGNQ